MNNYAGSNIKIKFIGIFLLVIMVLSTVFTQGCLRSCGAIDQEAWGKLLRDYMSLVQERDNLKKQVAEQGQAVAALQAQKGDIATAAQDVNTDITTAEGEAGNLQQQSAGNQAELESIDNQIAEKQAEVKKTEERIQELNNQIEETQSRINAITEFFGTWCFDGDTLVLMADGSMKKIKDIEAGEAVLAYDTTADTTVAADVIATANGEASYYYLINGNLKVTPPHPFLTAEGQWVGVEDLKAGDMIMSDSGTTGITSIELVESDLQIFNISVEDYHNFYVSADGQDFYLVKEQ